MGQKKLGQAVRGPTGDPVRQTERGPHWSIFPQDIRKLDGIKQDGTEVRGENSYSLSHYFIMQRDPGRVAEKEGRAEQFRAKTDVQLSGAKDSDRTHSISWNTSWSSLHTDGFFLLQMEASSHTTAEVVTYPELWIDPEEVN